MWINCSSSFSFSNSQTKKKRRDLFKDFIKFLQSQQRGAGLLAGGVSQQQQQRHEHQEQGRPPTQQRALRQSRRGMGQSAFQQDASLLDASFANLFDDEDDDI